MEHDMTTPVPFGQTLAFAEQKLTAVLRRHLAERQVVPETWYALQLVAQRGPALARDALIRDLEGSRTLTPASVRELLTRLEKEGLIQGDSEVDLTAEGETLYQSLREYVAVPTAELLGRFDAEDIAITMRTIQAITKEAERQLAAG
jgi:DNA-binding MarR family transcriptional regulator